MLKYHNDDSLRNYAVDMEKNYTAYTNFMPSDMLSNKQKVGSW